MNESKLQFSASILAPVYVFLCEMKGLSIISGFRPSGSVMTHYYEHG
jgi:hypothetical protein